MTAQSVTGIGKGAVNVVTTSGLQTQTNNVTNFPSAEYSTVSCENLVLEGSPTSIVTVILNLKNALGSSSFDACLLSVNVEGLTSWQAANIGSECAFILNYGTDDQRQGLLFFWNNTNPVQGTGFYPASLILVPTAQGSSNTRLAFRLRNTEEEAFEDAVLRVTFPDGTSIVSDIFSVGAG